MDLLGLEKSIGVALDPGTSLAGAKKFLASHGFDGGYGEPKTIEKFEKFADNQVSEGHYAGKSMKLGSGGRAALLRHKLIVSGDYGATPQSISQEDWSNINKIVRINYIKKYVH